MKRFKKILVLASMLLLIAVGIVLGAIVGYAADEPVRTGNMTGYDYTDVNGQVVHTDDLQEAFERAKEGSTIYANADQTFEFKSYTDTLHTGHNFKDGSGVNTNNTGTLTLDLDGHTITFIQQSLYNYVSLSSQKLFTVKNGTIKTGMTENAVPAEGSAFGYPLFRFNWGAAKLKLENVNTYTAGLAVVAGSSTTAKNLSFTVDGGDHYVITAPGEESLSNDKGNLYSDGAFIDTNNGVHAVIKNANFYIGENNYFISAESYADATATSVIEILGCTVVASDISQNVVKYASSNITFHVDHSKFYGSVNPALSAADAAKGLSPIPQANILLSHLTEWSSNGSFCDTTSDGRIENQEGSVTSLPLPAPDAQNGVMGVYTITNETATYTLDRRVFVDSNYEVLDANGEHVTYLPFGTSLKDAVATVGAKGTLKLMRDVEIEGQHENGNHKTYLATITKEMTIDLDGNMLAVKQVVSSAGTNAHEQRIGVQTTAPVVVKNGTIVCKADNGNKNYPLFVSEGTNINITFTDIDSYMGALCFVWRGPESKVTINGGTHNVIYHSTGSGEGYISTFDNIHVTANNAVFFTSNEYSSNARILGASNGTTQVADREIEFIFNNCDIIATNGVTSDGTLSAGNVGDLFKAANANTSIIFNNSRVFGKTPATCQSLFGSADPAVDAGTVIYGYNTKLVGANLGTDGLSVADRSGEFLAIDGGFTKTYTVGRFSNPNIFTYNYPTEEIELTVTFDTYANTADVFEIYKDGVFVEAISDTYYEDGNIATRGTFYQAINRAIALEGEGYTIKFLDDYYLDGTNPDEGIFGGSNASYFARITEGMTVDLDGYSFYMLKGTLDTATAAAGQEKITIETSSEVTFKNGRIMVDDVRSANATYAIFFFNGDMNEINLVLENLETHSGGLIYGYNSKTSTVRIIGGEHHLYCNMQGVEASGGMLVFRTETKLTATDAKFFLRSWSQSFIAINSLTENVSKTMESSFVFNNCDIIMDRPERNVIADFNGRSTAEFNGCRIVGSFNPSTYGKYDPANAPIKDYSVSFGMYNGIPTQWRTSGTNIRENLITTELGYAMKAENATGSYNITSFTIHTQPHKTDWKMNDFTVNATYNMTLAPGYVVNWYLYDSDTPYFASTVLPGETAKVPSVIPATVDINNGWYQLTHTGGWSSEMFSTTDNRVITADNTKLYPTATIKPYMTSVRYNLKLMGHVNLRFYIPTVTPTEIGEYTVSAGSKQGGTTVFGGQSYYCYNLATVGCTDIANTSQVNITFTIPVADSTMTLTQTITFSAIRYARQVLENQNGEFDDAVTLMADMMRYSYSVCEYLNYFEAATVQAKYLAIKELYEAHADKCSPINDGWFDYDNSLADAEEALDPYVEWISFEIYYYQPRFRVKFKESAKVTDVKFQVVDGWKPSNLYVEDGINWVSNLNVAPNPYWGYSYYAADGSGTPIYKAGSNYYVSDDNWNYGSTKGEAGAYLHIVCPDNMEIYNIDKLLRITVTYENEDSTTGTASGIYNIRSYVDYISSTDSITDEDLRSDAIYVMKCMQAYSSSAAGYRFGPAKDKDGYVSHGRINGYELP